MKSVIKIQLVVLILTGLINFTATAQQEKPTYYTADDIYEFFEHYSPGDIVEYAQAAVDFFGKSANYPLGISKEKEELIFKQLLEDFNKLPLKFQWQKFPLLPYIVPQRCDQFRVVAHPIPEFFGVMSQPGFLKQYKDARGKKIALQLCQKLSGNPNGVWGEQYQWWPQTDKPLEMGVLLLQIPNSPYQVHSFYPTRKYNQDQLNDLLNQTRR